MGVIKGDKRTASGEPAPHDVPEPIQYTYELLRAFPLSCKLVPHTPVLVPHSTKLGSDLESRSISVYSCKHGPGIGVRTIDSVPEGTRQVCTGMERTARGRSREGGGQKELKTHLAWQLNTVLRCWVGL